MLSNLPTIGARFDIDKIDSGSYGVECWKIFWRAVPPAELPGALLFEGDTAASMTGRENVYCIAVQCIDAAVVAKVRSALSQNADFLAHCAPPPLVEGVRCAAEPLPEAGRIDQAGNLIGNAWNSRSALGAVKKETAPAAEPGREISPAPARPRPASERTKDLPALAGFAELRKLVESRFILRGMDFEHDYWMTPEELCDIAERYAEMVEVQVSEYSCATSEDICCVRLFQRQPPEGRPIELHGLFPFPSESDALRFVQEYKSAPRYARELPRLAGIEGRCQLNFGKGSENPRDYTYRKENEIAATSLWPKLHARRVRLLADIRQPQGAPQTRPSEVTPARAADDPISGGHEPKTPDKGGLGREAAPARPPATTTVASSVEELSRHIKPLGTSEMMVRLHLSRAAAWARLRRLFSVVLEETQEQGRIRGLVAFPKFSQWIEIELRDTEPPIVAIRIRIKFRGRAVDRIIFDRVLAALEDASFEPRPPGFFGRMMIGAKTPAEAMVTACALPAAIGSIVLSAAIPILAGIGVAAARADSNALAGSLNGVLVALLFLIVPGCILGAAVAGLYLLVKRRRLGVAGVMLAMTLGGAGLWAGMLWSLKKPSFAPPPSSFTSEPAQLSGSETAPLLIASVTPDFFGDPPVVPVLGRSFVSSEYSEAAEVVLVSHAFWSDRLKRDPGVIGTMLPLNGQPARTIVGVMPAHVDVPAGVSLWTPIPPVGSAHAPLRTAILRTLAPLGIRQLTVKVDEGRAVTIGGRVNSATMRERAGETVALMPGVTKVFNELRVE